MMAKAERRYGFVRLFRKLALAIARWMIVPGKMRVRLVQWAGVNFTHPESVFIGENVVFDNIYPELITIGKRVRITNGTKILTHYLDVHQPPFSFYTGQVIIGDQVFIGANSLIVKPVKIGNNAVIAAGTVVTKDVEADCIVGGVPGKIIGKRDV